MAQSPLVQAMKKAGKRGLLARQSNKFAAGNQANLGMMSSPSSGGNGDMANPSAIMKALQGRKSSK